MKNHILCFHGKGKMSALRTEQPNGVRITLSQGAGVRAFVLLLQFHVTRPQFKIINEGKERTIS